MRLAIAGVVAAAALAGCGVKTDAAVDRAWVRLSAVPGRPAAAYFTLRAGSQPITLLSVRTPIAVRSELHESAARANGAMTMTELASVVVPGSGRVDFAPAGKHVMLLDVAPTVKPGDTTKLIFTFADGKTLEADAKLLAASDPAP